MATLSRGKTLFLTVTLISITAHAQDTGWYAGAGVGSSHIQVYRASWFGVGAWEEGPGDTATPIFGGYRSSDHLAVELSHLPEGDLEWRERGTPISGLPGYYDSSTVLSASALQLSVLGILPFANGWDAYLKGGVSWYRADAAQNVADAFGGAALTRSDSTSDAGFLLGLGVGASLTEHWRVRLEYQFYSIDRALINVENNDDPTVDTWIFGIDHRFSRSGQP